MDLANQDFFKDLSFTAPALLNQEAFSKLREDVDQAIKKLQASGEAEGISSVGRDESKETGLQDVVRARKILNFEPSLRNLFNQVDDINVITKGLIDGLDGIKEGLVSSLKSGNIETFNATIEQLKDLRGIDSTEIVKTLTEEFIKVSDLEGKTRLDKIAAIKKAGDDEINVRKNYFEQLKSSF